VGIPRRRQRLVISRDLVPTFRGSDGSETGQALVGDLEECVVGAQPQRPLKCVAGIVEVT
jgi:hypothetical protein